MIYLERFLLQGLNCIHPRARTEPVDSHEQTRKQLCFCCPNRLLVMPMDSLQAHSFCVKSQAALGGWEVTPPLLQRKSSLGGAKQKAAKGVCPDFLWPHFPENRDCPRCHGKALGDNSKKDKKQSCFSEITRAQGDIEQLLLKAKQSELLFAEISGVACPAASPAHSVNTKVMPTVCSKQASDHRLPRITLPSKKNIIL